MTRTLKVLGCFATENKIEIHRDIKFLPEKTEVVIE